MWQCPKCQREFKNTNQEHFCDKPAAICDYIQAQPAEVQPLLEELHQTIRNTLPAVEERISWAMPTYWDKHNIIHFASFKKHIGLYPGEEAIAHFSEKLTDYKTSKGAIQFPFNKPIPFALIAEIANWCYSSEKSSIKGR